MYTQLYFDYNATTPCSSEVMDAMMPYFKDHFGNPSSSHHPYGWLARSAVDDSRAAIAEILGVEANELIFTSGATESINTILKGIVRKHRGKRNHIITTKAEHKAVLDTCAFLEADGVEVTYLDVNSQGLVCRDEFENALREDTMLVSVMYANNETGIIQPLDYISELTRANGALLFSDLTQVLGKADLRGVLKLVDFACFSGHKVYAPKGIGLIYARNNPDYNALPSFIQGGGQQKGQRGGTINTPLIVGLAKAIIHAEEILAEECLRLQSLRDRLDEGLLDIELAVSNNRHTQRLPNTSHFSFPYVDGGSLLTALGRRIAVSNGSACNSASVAPSHVLLAMGIDPSLAFASIRLSIGRYTTEDDIEKAIDLISTLVAEQREENIMWERRGKL
jgi:cysteine desulfurase